ncbi:MAG: response regulator [Anaerolineae bacterium]
MPEELEDALREALAHLYDPGYLPEGSLYALLDSDPHEGALGIQNAIARLIETLQPLPDAPLTAKTRQMYDLLYDRFVLKLTQRETADRMHTSLSTVQRAQREALRVLARVLVAQGQAPAADYRAQFERERASLEANAPSLICDVGEVIVGLLELAGAVSASFGVRVEVGHVQPGLVAAVHPVLLRQVLIALLQRLAPHAADRRIAVFARLENGSVRLTLTAALAEDNTLQPASFTDDLLVPEGVAVSAGIERTQAFLWLDLPSPRAVTVLVVDDNPDMARFFQRATEGTRYRIVNTIKGQDLFEVIDATAPGIIVLDVMLPDVDGWHLLMCLHENPATRPIPVIICSVIRQEDLALSLGAKRYLPKPVRPSEFIAALDQALPQDAAAGPTAPVTP